MEVIVKPLYQTPHVIHFDPKSQLRLSRMFAKCSKERAEYFKDVLNILATAQNTDALAKVTALTSIQKTRVYFEIEIYEYFSWGGHPGRASSIHAFMDWLVLIPSDTRKYIKNCMRSTSKSLTAKSIVRSSRSSTLINTIIGKNHLRRH